MENASPQGFLRAGVVLLSVYDIIYPTVTAFLKILNAILLPYLLHPHR